MRESSVPPADNAGMRWEWLFLGAGVLMVALVAVLLMRPIPGAPDPNSKVAVDCSSGGGWVGYDGKTYCP